MDMPTTEQKILVWDVPTRVFHWALVLCFAGAYLTAEEDGWMLVHVTLGYTLGALVLFRLAWGFVGTRYARFSNFVRGPQGVLAYLRSILRGQPQHFTGHNPAGALFIVTILVLAIPLVASGFLLYEEITGEWMEEVHEVVANVMVALVFIHIAAVLVSSWLHHENLVGAMFSGCKRGQAGDAIGRAFGWLAAVMLVAMLGFWLWQWEAGGGAAASAASEGAELHQE